MLKTISMQKLRVDGFLPVACCRGAPRMKRRIQMI